MDYQKEVTRALIRGAGYRIWRGLPWWAAGLFLLLLFLFGGR
jgi:hypothetical protein